MLQMTQQSHQTTDQKGLLAEITSGSPIKEKNIDLAALKIYWHLIFFRRIYFNGVSVELGRTFYLWITTICYPVILHPRVSSSFHSTAYSSL